MTRYNLISLALFFINLVLVISSKKSEFKKVYSYSNGGRRTVKGGTSSGDFNSPFINAGFKLHNDPEVIANIMGLMGVSMPEPEYIIPYVKKGNFAVYVLSRISGEGTNRNVIKGDVYLTDTETKMITDLAKGFKKFILVLNTGGPVDLSGLDLVKNILVLSQLGVNTSKALVDIIIGNKYPSGKLTTTWTKFEDYPTIGDFGDDNDTHYKEGVYVGYRYFDTENANVMFPFCFGLDYTDFKFDIISANLKVKSKEVLELYLSKPNTTLDEPYQILVGFAKTKELKPSKKTTLKLSSKLSDFASYDTKTVTYILDKGSYIVRIGNSSRNTKPCFNIIVKSRINVIKVANKMGQPEFKDYVPKGQRKKEDLKLVKKFTLDPSSIKQKVVKYNKKFEIAKAVKEMTDEEIAKIVIGSYEDSDKDPFGAAGAADGTSKVAGLEPILFSDGPADLRISKDYYTDESGNHPIDNPNASLFEFFPDFIKAFLGGNNEAPENAEVLHQYTTAIPIGTALAQTWNKEFTEMAILLVSILNGRNFEYYSEDPFISGTFATAITKGVQSHPQRFVTIKHYAANGQETNRYGSNSHVSERALRIICLRGFEMCIRDSHPRAVMTSFNLINGVHTNQSKELNVDILKIEFGFDGLVTIDWMGTADKNNKYPQETSDGDYENILSALKNNTLTRKELELSATNVYKFALEIEQ
ncbi:glycoside hydrolase family 3 protein [Neocallimastix lanati (nom. inval.)]|nr:glycoside hydrolase family 3 protein [Neocallimastix sp. JGI-2020a]